MKISYAITAHNEAEELNNKAFEQRKESATKTGAEKNDLITQALENERLSIDKKLAASIFCLQKWLWVSLSFATRVVYVEIFH